MGSSSSSSFKFLFGMLIVVGCFWLLLVGSLDSGEKTTAMTTTTRTALSSTQSTGKPKHDKVVGRGEFFVDHPELDLTYMMSKRRVPNGPDPIHNRRAGNSRRPPGRA